MCGLALVRWGPDQLLLARWLYQRQALGNTLALRFKPGVHLSGSQPTLRSAFGDIYHWFFWGAVQYPPPGFWLFF
jgi:hypothetical protein